MFPKKGIFKEIYRKRSEIAVKELKKNGFDAFYIDNSKDALLRILSLIPEKAKIGIAGSVTIREMGLFDELQNRGYSILSDWGEPRLRSERLKIRRAGLVSDIFLTSTNAITLEGQLVNVDGTGNRVAALIFGPKKVIVVAGANKIVDNINDAFARIRNVAKPLNGERLNLKTPCALTGRCTDCSHEERMCKVSTVIEKKPNLSDITIFIIGENLGF